MNAHTRAVVTYARTARHRVGDAVRAADHTFAYITTLGVGVAAGVTGILVARMPAGAAAIVIGIALYLTGYCANHVRTIVRDAHIDTGLHRTRMDAHSAELLAAVTAVNALHHTDAEHERLRRAVNDIASLRPKGHA